MHLIVNFAAPALPAGRQALAALPLPHLHRLLARWPGQGRDIQDNHSLSSPAERAHARAVGLQGADGALPWAAGLAAADGIDVGVAAWALMTPVHIAVDRHQAVLHDPQALALDEAESRALLEAVRPLFEEDGLVLAWGAPLRWYAAHVMFDGLASAGLDRVVARDVTPWLPKSTAARALRRLQNEVQMVFHTHPVNAQREARQLRPVNSLWCSGCGPAQPPARVASPHVDQRLRTAAWQQDWAAWSVAWADLDETVIRPLLDDPIGRLTLCGEHGSASWGADGGLWRRLGAMVRRP
ncbi:MAG: hypothetical protein ACKVQR_16245, partial [Aquabacterium sp.]